MDADEIAVVQFRRVLNLIKAKVLDGLETNKAGNQMDERLDEVNRQFVRLRVLLLRLLEGQSAQGEQEQQIQRLFEQYGGLSRARHSREAKDLLHYYIEVDLCDYPYTLNLSLTNAFLKKDVPGQDLCSLK
jgi:hypothetical protein